MKNPLLSVTVKTVIAAALPALLSACSPADMECDPAKQKHCMAFIEAASVPFPASDALPPVMLDIPEPDNPSDKMEFSAEEADQKELIKLPASQTAAASQPDSGDKLEDLPVIGSTIQEPEPEDTKNIDPALLLQQRTVSKDDLL